MSKSQITITLGSSSKKVVRRQWAPQDSSQTQLRSKRSLQDDSFLFTSKRARRNDSVKSFASNAAGSKIGGNDLRLKLMRKRISEPQQSNAMHGSVTRGVQSVKKSERSNVRSIPSGRGERPRVELTHAYSSKAPDGLRLKSIDVIAKTSPPVADVRSMNKMGQAPSSRLINLPVSRHTDVVKPSLTKIPVHVPVRPSLDACKQATEPPVATSTILKSPPLNARKLSVKSFLHSLGLEKYVINFQAEEIDMAVLKQMGDRDLKELGLPMGPRKKILLSLIPPARRPSA